MKNNTCLLCLLIGPLFLSCQNDIQNVIPADQNGREQKFLLPNNGSSFSVAETVHFKLLTDTTQPLQILWIIKRNDSTLSPHIQIANIVNFTNLYWDTTFAAIISVRDTLDSLKVTSIDWQLPDTLDGLYELWYQHFVSDSIRCARIKLKIVNPSAQYTIANKSATGFKSSSGKKPDRGKNKYHSGI